MKSIKILGLAAMALTALMAMAGAASATTLTSPTGTTYTSTIKAEASSTITLTSAFGGFGSVACKSSVVEGKMEKHGSGVTTGGNLTKLTFSECTGGTPTTTTLGGGETHPIGSGTELATGTLTSTGTTVQVTGTLLGTCNFKTNATDLGTVDFATAANPTKTAEITLSATIPGENCGNATMEGSYKVVSPDPLFLDS